MRRIPRLARLSLASLLLILISASSAWALSCMQPFPTWWPGTEGTLSPTPLIVLDEEQLDAAWFEGPSRVDAEITAVNGYVLIRPKTPLTVGARYTLKGKGPHRFSKGPWARKRVEKDGQRTDTQVPLTWTIKADASAAPTWTGAIEVGAGSARHGVWGTTSSQILTLPWTSAAPAIAEVKMTRGATTKLLYLPVTQGKPLRFGRGLCGGELNLVGESDWTAAVTLIGPSGQRSETRSVTFPSPVPTGHIPFGRGPKGR